MSWPAVFTNSSDIFSVVNQEIQRNAFVGTQQGLCVHVTVQYFGVVLIVIHVLLLHYLINLTNTEKTTGYYITIVDMSFLPKHT